MSNGFSLKELWENELFPVGSFETIPVNVTKLVPFEDYPSVIKVLDVPNYKELYKEYLQFSNSKNISASRYIKERLKYLKLPLKEWSELFKDLGFNDKEYETYSMRQLGSNITLDEIGPLTQLLLARFPVDIFRQQYAIAHPGWKTKSHIDTNRLDLHGFRVMIPLNEPFSIGFNEGLYELDCGYAYFINVAKMHYGINPQSKSRCNIMLHLSSDSMLNFNDKVTYFKQNTI